MFNSSCMLNKDVIPAWIRPICTFTLLNDFNNVSRILEFSLRQLVFGLISAAQYSPTRLGLRVGFFFGWVDFWPQAKQVKT